MTTELRCQCGAFHGHIDVERTYACVSCYCKDCQAFARFLQRENSVLNGKGGTDILATLPASITFDQGEDKLACMSLRPNGLLRWYAHCCNTPICNTPRDRNMPYVGVVSACVPEFDARFGKPTVAINTESATGAVESRTLARWLSVLRIIRKVLAAKISGAAKENPFFKPGSSAPIREPHVVTLEERNVL